MRKIHLPVNPKVTTTDFNEFIYIVVQDLDLRITRLEEHLEFVPERGSIIEHLENELETDEINKGDLS